MSAAAATKAANRFIFTTATGAVRRINLNSFNPVKTATGSWHAAKFGRLHFARLRKECLDAGIQDHPFQKAERVIKPVVFKGQKYLIKKQKREDIIAAKMKDMPAKLEDYYTNMRTRRMRAYDPLYVIRHGFNRMK